MCVYRIAAVCVTDAGLSVGGLVATGKETQKNKKCQGDEMMGDWGYFFVLVIGILLALFLGFGWGSDYGYKQGYMQGKEDEKKSEKERQRKWIDAKV